MSILHAVSKDAILILALFVLCNFSCGCGGGITATDTALVGVETEQQRECVDRFVPDAAAQNECRAVVRATWDHYWSGRFDGGE